MEGRDLNSLNNMYVLQQHKHCSSVIGTLPSQHTSLSTYAAATRQLFLPLPHVQHHTSPSYAATALGQNILPLSRFSPPSTPTNPALNPQTHIPRRCSHAAAPTSLLPRCHRHHHHLSTPAWEAENSSCFFLIDLFGCLSADAAG